MTFAKFFPMNPATRQPRSVTVGDRTVIGRLSYGDMPVGFGIEANAETRRLKIHYIYPAGLEEPKETKRHGHITIVLGIHSFRLFEVTFDDFDPVALAQPNNTDRMLAEIRDTFRKLLASAPRAGSQLNYRVAEEGLNIETTSTPEWLLETLKTLRSEQSKQT